MNQNILKIIRDSKFSFSQLSCCYPELCALKNIPQNPEYHKEGDVYHHTELVCEKLLALFEWKELTQEEQELLFLAAAFHDIRKNILYKTGKWYMDFSKTYYCRRKSISTDGLQKGGTI